ncbi:unnamed protein product [Owenia fusiformis]|uniref:Anaphase-promoting complex subunit 1 n=1 Tax=Owenia fusiformis TaxID=6347 RepID=A0A8S4PJJ6_OWEFU|nr:unnamed protein product [Owenia fusiformis]
MLDHQTSEDMITVSDWQDYVPHGRDMYSSHPGVTHSHPGYHTDHGLPIVKAIKDISLQDDKQGEQWRLRSVDNMDNVTDEELYIAENTVLWSRGTVDGARSHYRSFTVDSRVTDAGWCKFLLPKTTPEEPTTDALKDMPGTAQYGVYILESSCIHVFTTEGEDFTTALPFTVSKVWPIMNGLLFERSTKEVELKGTPRKPTEALPLLFSMLHPLDELAPLIYSKAQPGSNKIEFVTDTSQHVVFTNEDPSLIMTYDQMQGTHSVWRLRRAKHEEGYYVTGCLGDLTPSMLPQPPGTPGVGVSHSTSSFSKLTISSQSPSGLSPFRSFQSHPNSRISSPSGGFTSRSISHSPGLNQMAALSRSQTPSHASVSSLYRYHSPSPGGKSPMGSLMRTPGRQTVSMVNETGEIVEPLMPDTCMEHIWTEKVSLREGMTGKATKVFLTKDLGGQQYLCYLVASRYQLRCVKWEESNDQSQLIFGAVSIVQARDAVSLPSLNMVLVLDLNSTLLLYTGPTKVTRVFLPSLPISSVHLSTSEGLRSTTPFASPGPGIVTSSRPTSALDAHFDDPVHLLSPVPPEMNESSQLLHAGSLGEDLSIQSSITSLQDPVANRCTLDLANGSLCRITIPSMETSPIIDACLEGIKHILPNYIASQVLIKWYSTHNAPGGMTKQTEWLTFTKCLLGMMGYDLGRLPLVLQMDIDSPLSPVTKKAKPSDQGSDEDWQYLLSSDHHNFVTSILKSSTESAPRSDMKLDRSTPVSIDTSAALFPHIPALLYALHLVYEDMKLNSQLLEHLHKLTTLLHHIARDLQLSAYIDHYVRDYPALFNSPEHTSQILPDTLKQMQYPSFLSQEPPSLYRWLHCSMTGAPCKPFPYLSDVCKVTMNIVSLYAILLHPEESSEPVWDRYVRKVSAPGHRVVSRDVSMSKSFTPDTSGTVFERVVLYMAELGMTSKDLDLLPFGISHPLYEAIHHCRANPPSDWPDDAYILIGREDLHQQANISNMPPVVTLKKEMAPQSKGVKEEEDGMEFIDRELLRLLFSDDLRIQEVRRLLQSARPVRIALSQRPEVSDHDFIEEQERHLYGLCIRTMALSVGRGMFTLSSYHSLVTEQLPIPKLCLTGKAPPRNTTVDLSHIETPPNMAMWPQFHNGVAAGLRLAGSAQVDTTWIVYNKPKQNELTNEHAGFLMALGLRGHLSNLATMNVHDYLARGHDMTSVGLLLGIAAAKRGSMDLATTKLLSIHVDALLPPSSTELDVPHIVQVAAVLGVGLVYQCTAHRHIAEVLLSEIGRPPGPEMENSLDREAYSIAAGLALGLVMLGKGSEVIGLADLSMADQLYNYIVGGHKRPLSGTNKERFKSPSYQIKEGDTVNVDVTSPGATLALGMMFFCTNNTAVGEWLTAPDTQFLLDFVRPDFLLLRVIGRGLVFWEYVLPSKAWIKENIPEIVMKYAFKKSDYKDDPDCHIDFETMSQAYCNIMAGACMTIGLKFAGSANQEAFNLLMGYAKEILAIVSKASLLEQAGKSTVENSLDIIVLSLSMVMSGTGNLDVLRLCRHLRSRVGSSYTYVLYGSHMAVSMSLGLLFLGGCRYTLRTSPEAVGAMLCAFFPKYPVHSNDNRYHLQAFRHLYVLAAEPRMVIPRDVDTGHVCYVPMEIHFKVLVFVIQYEEL